MKTRKTIQLISLLLFPVTIYYFSPAIIIYGILESTVTGSFILFMALTLTATFFNRLFCSTLCPAGAIQDLMIGINNKSIKSPKLPLSKWFVYSLWMAIMIYLIIEKGLTSVDPLYQTNYGISVTDPGGYIVLYGVIGIFMILAAIFGNRGGCHTICWMAPFMIIGDKIGRTLKLPYYGLEKTSNPCINCGKCTTACPMSLDVEKMVVEDAIHNHDCISCKKCVVSCPKKVLDMGVVKA